MPNVTDSNITDITNLTATIQDYLSLIYVLERDNEQVIGSHLATIIGVTPPTITNTLKRMTRDGLITMNAEGTHLTELGWDAARIVMRRHMLMEWMMFNTLPWSKLHAEAHQLEHAISSMTETALIEQLNNPQTCPHGNPLPGCEQVVSSWIPLIRVPVGTSFVVRRIHELAEENYPLLAFLEKNRIVPGTRASTVEVLPFNHTLTVESDGNLVTLGDAVARYIHVELTAD